MGDAYKLKKFTNNKGILNKYVDATYILYLEGNEERYNNIIKQLNNIKPTDIIYILFNKGWKSGCKRSYITNSAIDIVDANITCFYHARKKNYNNILILEDDFIFDDKIKDKNVIENINKFLSTRMNKSFSLYLGTIPFIFLPYNLNINKGIINIYTHSIIFSKEYRNKVLKYNYKNLFCWDIFQLYFNYNKFYYNIPLIYQKIEETENSNNWPILPLFRYLYLKFTNYLNANNDPKFFFNFVYILSYFITLFIIMIIIYIYYKVKKIIIT